MRLDPKSSVRALMDERRAAEKKIERLRLDAHAIACSMFNAAKILSTHAERLTLPGLAPDERFDGQPGAPAVEAPPADVPGVDRIRAVVAELRAAMAREHDAREQLCELGVDLEKIEDEILAANSRAIRRFAVPGLSDEPKRQPIGFDRKGDKPK